MDTLVQISPFLGHARSKNNNVLRVYDFVGQFYIMDESSQQHLGSINVKRQSNNLKQYVFETLPQGIIIEESNESSGGIGAGCWLSSLCLSCWILNNRHVFSGKRVLELGSGVGLCGIVVSCLNNITRIKMSDKYPALLTTMKQNVEHNQTYIKTIPIIEKFDWKTNHDTSPYDIIIASDCIYHDTKDIFKKALTSCIKDGGKIILVNPPDDSRPGIDEFLYEMAEIGRINIHNVSINMNKDFKKSLMIILIDMFPIPTQPDYVEKN